jgi:hypothetical protein
MIIKENKVSFRNVVSDRPAGKTVFSFFGSISFSLPVNKEKEMNKIKKYNNQKKILKLKGDAETSSA